MVALACVATSSQFHILNRGKSISSNNMYVQMPEERFLVRSILVLLQTKTSMNCGESSSQVAQVCVRCNDFHLVSTCLTCGADHLQPLLVFVPTFHKYILVRRFPA